MVDVSDKPDTRREARAEARVRMSAETLHLIETGGHRKGDVLTVARIAGIQAAKRCAEMEALTAAAVAALTIYDMCKAVDRGMVIEGIRLLHKSGGRSGEWTVERAD